MNRIKIYMRLALWQPPPYIAYTKSGEPLSWWFYRKFCGFKVFYARNKLGNAWYDYWFHKVRNLEKRG